MTDPIASMTGYGAGLAEREGVSARVEIRAVNHRGLKVNVRSRPPLGPLENTLREAVGRRLHRGAVDVTVSVTRPVDPAHLPVREDLAEAAVQAARHLAARFDLGGDLTVRDLLAIPGLLDEGMEGPLGEGEWPVIEAAADEALGNMETMRRTEGAATALRLEELVAPIDVFVRMAREQAPAVVERQRRKLEERYAELCPDGLRGVDEQSLEREICLYADRADINEELDRLASHIDQFRGILAAGGEVGKRIEFLAQEFLREINTCSVKCNCTEITAAAVEAKLATEKVKEQAANLE